MFFFVEKHLRNVCKDGELEVLVDFQWLNTRYISFGQKWNWDEGEELVWLCGLNAEA
jgi:hypothetical protein